MASARRLVVPEVVQTSAMDCGPAALKCLLEGFGVPVSYGRLREACQTDVDGTSIDTLEDIARRLGLDAQQVMLPVDHVLLPEAAALPALVVVRAGSGLTHFVVAWSRHGRWVQVMDPATGRRWPSVARFLDDLYVHEMPIPAAAWREWAGGEEAARPLLRRLADVAARGGESLLHDAVADPTWRSLAALDATTRLVARLVDSGGVRRGAESARILERMLARAREEAASAKPLVPASCWSVRPAGAASDADAGEEHLVLRGAVLVRVSGLHEATHHGDANEASAEQAGAAARGRAASLPPELVAALEEAPSRPGRRLIELLRAEGPAHLGAFAAAVAAGGAAVAVQALLLRALLDVGRHLPLTGDRLAAIGAVMAFVLGVLLLELPVASALRRVGRGLETRLRAAFLAKIPRLADRYFASRPVSDMAERGHGVHRVRELPDLAARLVRLLAELAFTAVGIAWIDPRGIPLVAAMVVVAVGLPLLLQPWLVERDLRVQTQLGSLLRFNLDALLGLVPIRSHGAERAVRREHESLLVEWGRASASLVRARVVVEGVVFLAGFATAAAVLLSHLAREGASGSVLLLAYWVLRIPAVGQQVAAVAQRVPSLRSKWDPLESTCRHASLSIL